MKRNENMNIWYRVGLLIAVVVIVLAGAFLLTNTAKAAGMKSQGEEMILYKNFAFYSSSFTNEPTNTLEIGLPETIIDGSLILTPASAHVVEQSVIRQETGLENFIGEQITAYDDQTKVSGKLLEVEGGRVYIETNEGVYALYPQGYVLPEFEEKKTIGRFVLDEPDSQFKTYYAFSGMDWDADYYLFINGENGVLKARANINNNCGKDIENTKVKLVAGEINYGQRYYPSPIMGYGKSAVAEAPMGNVEYEGKTEEFHVYEIKSPVSIADGEKKTYELYEEPVEVARTLEYNSYGYEQEQSALSTIYSFKAPREMPSGEVKIVADGMLVGADQIENKGNGTEVELYAGKSFDVSGKTEEVDYKESLLSYEYTYNITIENSGEEEENIRVNFNTYGGEWEITDTSDEPAEMTPNKITWKFRLGKGKKTITFKIRYSKG